MRTPPGKLLGSLLAGLGLCVCFWLAPSEAAPTVRETHRIRIENRVGGPVSVSVSRGERYSEVTRVRRPAATTTTAFPALGGADPGSVALLAPDRWLIHLQTPSAAAASPSVIGVGARGSGGGDAFAELDAPPSSALFTALAPHLGARLFLQRRGALEPVTKEYRPAQGDVWVLVSELPAELPVEFIIENRSGGNVTARWKDARVTRVGSVTQPVHGVGRYPAASGVPSGRLATRHPRGLLVAVGDAAPGGGSLGFMIQPPGLSDTGEPGPSTLVIEPSGEGVSLFGTPFPFRGSATETRVDIRRAGRAWEGLPAASGPDEEALHGEDGTPPERFRMRVGSVSSESLTAAVRGGTAGPSIAASGDDRAAGGQDRVYRGKLTVTANVTGRGIEIVKFLLDGRVRAIDNVRPYTWEWDTRESSNGEHVIEIQGLDLEGRLINTTRSRVIVAN